MRCALFFAPARVVNGRSGMERTALHPRSREQPDPSPGVCLNLGFLRGVGRSIIPPISLAGAQRHFSICAVFGVRREIFDLVGLGLL